MLKSRIILDAKLHQLEFPSFDFPSVLLKSKQSRLQSLYITQLCITLSTHLTPHTNKEEVYRVLKPLHVIFYRPFNRSMGLSIINEFLKSVMKYTHE